LARHAICDFGLALDAACSCGGDLMLGFDVTADEIYDPLIACLEKNDATWDTISLPDFDSEVTARYFQTKFGTPVTLLTTAALIATSEMDSTDPIHQGEWKTSKENWFQLFSTIAPFLLKHGAYGPVSLTDPRTRKSAAITALVDALEFAKKEALEAIANKEATDVV
jgi:hypothetical protein